MHFYTPWTNNVSLVYMLANDMHTPPILDHNSYRLSIIFEFWLHISCPYSSGSIVTLGQKTEQKWFHMTCKSCCCPHNKNGKEKNKWIMAKTCWGSYECANVGYGEPKFNFLLCHAPMDLNLPNQDDTPFTFGIQTLWQAKMMTKFGHKSSISFDVTFNTNQSWVHFIHCFVYKLSFI